MPIRDILENQSIVECRGEQTVKDAAMAMQRDNVGAVVVTKDNKAQGVVTDRDIALRCVAEGEDPNKMQLKDIMTSPVVTVRKDEGIYHIIDKMKDSQCRRIVIVDEKEKPMGLISSGDLLKLLFQELSMLEGIVTPEKEKIRRHQAAS